ncbi:MAG: helix-turn-helix domain-containing protein [Acidimicrobiales bacterium]|nr:helix-turn-helix domain-containing protein [Acidimicrobiales bacterium]
MDTEGWLNLKQVARILGVHYMTAYRYVRTGQLEASLVNSSWLVDPDALEAFRRPSATSDDDVESVDRVARLHARLLRGDVVGAWAIVEDALVAGWGPEEALIDLIVAAVSETEQDDGLAAGHLVGTTAWRTAAQLSTRFRRRGRDRGTVVLGAPEGEGHSLGLSFIADVLRVRNVAVLELGHDVSPAAFVEAAASAERLVAVGIGVTDPTLMGAARDVVLAVREDLPGVPVLLGGRAVANDGIASLAGADGWASDLRGVGDLVDELIRQRSSRRTKNPTR